MGDHEHEHRRLTELEGDEATALADEARESEYYERLESYLADEYDETVPTDDPRAFERGDGVRAVSFEADPEPKTGARPSLAVTVHVDDGSIVQATAERHGPDADGDVELVFPSEIAPRPETAVRDIVQPEGQSADIEVTVTETDEITTYTIDL